MNVSNEHTHELCNYALPTFTGPAKHISATAAFPILAPAHQASLFGINKLDAAAKNRLSPARTMV